MNKMSDFKSEWNQARPFYEWIDTCRKENRKPNLNDLKFIERIWAEYGDWELYRDKDGTYYKDYTPIGD